MARLAKVNWNKKQTFCLKRKKLEWFFNGSNKFFSENLEDHFDKYTKPYRTFARIKGKKNKIPTYKSKNKQTRISVDKEQGIEIFLPLESKVDVSSNSIIIPLDFEPHIPVAVYKTLVKMALSLIEDEKEVSAFQMTIKWLLEKDHTKHFMLPLKMQAQFVENDILESFVCLFRRKEGKNVPYAIFIISFGNWLYQIIVPSHLDGESFLYMIPYFYIPIEKVFVKTVDLSITEKQSFSQILILKYRTMNDLVL